MTQLLKLSSNKRFLIREDGSPFFWLGDTAWELFHVLNREEAELYLKNRAENKFNVIQAVALAELDGIKTPNAYGQRPFLKNEKDEYDPTLPDIKGDYSYWDHVDYIIKKAESLNIYIAILLTWGDKFNKKWGKGPEFFNEKNAEIYAKWLAERYSKYNNIIWVLGGDRPLEKENHYKIIRSMGRGIREKEEKRHLITFHPTGASSSTDVFDNSESILDFNMLQSGHGTGQEYEINYKKVKKDYNLTPVKPVLDGEPRYEDHPVDFKPEKGYFDDFDVRQRAYWAVFAGGFGHTYGHHSIWSMTTEPEDYFIMTWKEAINRPGGEQMQYLRKLIESRSMLERIPDQNLIVKQYEGENHIQACRGKNYAFIYTPNGLPLEINMGIINGNKVKASWYNPRTGEYSDIGKIDNKGEIKYNSPTHGRNNDWVLVLDTILE